MQLVDYLLVIILLILTALLAKVYFWDRRWLLYYSLRFEGPLSLPLIGSLHRLVASKNIYDMIQKLNEEYPDPHKFWAGEKLYIGSSRPRDIAIVANTNLEKDSHVYAVLKDAIGDSLLTATLSRWKIHNKVAAPMLSKTKLVPFIETFGNESEKLIKKLEGRCEEGFFDICNLVHAFTFNLVMETLLDSSMESDELAEEYIGWLERVTKLSTIKAATGSLGISSLWTPLSKEYNTKLEAIRNTFRQVVNKKEKETNRKPTLINRLIEATKEDKNWNLEDRTDLCLTMVGSASHSSNSGINFILTALGIHQDVQEKVFQEQLNIFHDLGRNPTVDDLNQMVYLERVIHETLRLFPLGPVFSREIRRYVELDDYHILPKGSVFVANVIKLHRNAKYWPDPLKFDPDRFLPEEVSKRPPGVYIPFSVGARGCIGINYAMIELKIILSKVTRRFRVESPLKSLNDIRLGYEIVLLMEDGCQIAFYPRTGLEKNEKM